MPDLSIENTCLGPVAGVDEAGRGPLAGPVVAAAVILGENFPTGLNDSKKLTEKKRELLFGQIMASCEVGVGIIGPEEIDSINILQASHKAMVVAVEQLKTIPQTVLVDGNLLPKTLKIPAKAIIKGDALSLSIAAASIIAKVTRDRIMAELHSEHPEYGWLVNKGYPTASHREAIKLQGLTKHHRRSFTVKDQMELKYVG